LLEQIGLKNEVEFEVKDNKIIVKPITKLRAGWEDDFKRMSQNKDDVLLDKEYLENQSAWDNEEWKW
jgi:antitoxin component of MazEF toxin-antitoxin module